jgi:hypothetical protein
VKGLKKNELVANKKKLFFEKNPIFEEFKKNNFFRLNDRIGMGKP